MKTIGVEMGKNARQEECKTWEHLMDNWVDGRKDDSPLTVRLSGVQLLLSGRMVRMSKCRDFGEPGEAL